MTTNNGEKSQVGDKARDCGQTECADRDPGDMRQDNLHDVSSSSAD